ncbi:hypothetical protein, partial [Ilyomonas limi]|uniref:hypothetical protein n=1 Tax=Ilyomonas limi TaxID=2575867 RepID=UPI0019824DB7
DIHNDTIKLIHYDSYGYIHSLHKDNTKGEAELRGTNPKRLERKLKKRRLYEVFFTYGTMLLPCID